MCAPAPMVLSPGLSRPFLESARAGGALATQPFMQQQSTEKRTTPKKRTTRRAMSADRLASIEAEADGEVEVGDAGEEVSAATMLGTPIYVHTTKSGHKRCRDDILRY